MRLDLHAQRLRIRNNYIHHVGHMGILLCGYGPGTKDVNKHNLVSNNLIHHCGEVIWHGHAVGAFEVADPVVETVHLVASSAVIRRSNSSVSSMNRQFVPVDIFQRQ